MFHSPGTGQGPVLDSGAVEWSPHQSTHFSPKAATTVKGEGMSETETFFPFNKWKGEKTSF